MVDARDQREAEKPIIKKVKNKPNFEQWEYVYKACEIIANTGEFHVDYGPLMFHFKEVKDGGDDYAIVTVTSKLFKTSPFKITNTEGDYMFFRYPEAFFAVQDFIESLQYENEVNLPEEEYD